MRFSYFVVLGLLLVPAATQAQSWYNQDGRPIYDQRSAYARPSNQPPIYDQRGLYAQRSGQRPIYDQRGTYYQRPVSPRAPLTGGDTQAADSSEPVPRYLGQPLAAVPPTSTTTAVPPTSTTAAVPSAPAPAPVVYDAPADAAVPETVAVPVGTNAAPVPMTDGNARMGFFKDVDLLTHTGVEAGLSLSRYEYSEPTLDVHVNGIMYGLNLVLTKSLYGKFFGKIDARYAGGNMDYSGSGTQDEEPHTLFEGRLLFGRDITFDSFALSPYIGFGFRYLHDNGIGVTSTGAHGYRRQNQLSYVPVGVTYRTQLSRISRLSFNAEFDGVFYGRQVSNLSDVGNGSPDLTNTQSGGYGFRGDLMYETSHVSFGPYFNLWDIDASDIVCATGPLHTVCGLEPNNKTLEWGLKAMFKI